MSDGGPARPLGLPSAAALVVASMIGAGVFTTSGFALADLGRPAFVLAAWGLGGALALCGALCYGALARAFPESGGEYLFLARTLHPAAGFCAGWISLLAGFTGPLATAALGLAAYLEPVIGEPSTAGMPTARLLGTAAIVGAALLHALPGVRGVLVQDAAVVLKLVLIVVFVAWGATRAGTPTLAPEGAAAALPAFDLGAFAVTLVWISFSYSGWNAAVYVAGEVADPERNLPRSLVLGTSVVTLLYLALNAVFVYAAPVEALAGRADVGAVAAEALGGPGWRRGLSVLVALALGTSVSSLVMAGPRVYARMAADGLFPQRLAAPAGAGPPRAAIAAQAVLAVAVVWIADLQELLGTIGFLLGLSATVTVVALVVERRRRGASRLPIPGYPWTPAIFVAATLASSAWLVARRPGEALVGLLVALTAVPAYALARRAGHKR